MSASTVVARTADAVVVGGGTVGGWCAWFLRQMGVPRVLLVEAVTLGSGASSRAAGMVRAQGGTPHAVRLGMVSQDFYRAQRTDLGLDSGFVEQGYFMPCFTAEDVSEAHARISMQQSLGLDVRWCPPDEVYQMNPALAPRLTLGASYAPGDGYLEPSRNVQAYIAALTTSGVEILEHTDFTGMPTTRGRVVGIETTAGSIDSPLVVLTGGPRLAAIGAVAGVRVPVGGARHQVVVTEPHPDLRADRLPMIFDVRSGIYWRPEEGGLLWGMSNPAETPGEAREFDWDYYRSALERMHQLVPATRGLGLRKAWAATIDYTSDHLPILGRALVDGESVDGCVVASAAGHGMMWGPAVARAAAELAFRGSTDVVDVTDLGLDRFDEQGRSRMHTDPIALPFPTQTAEPVVTS